MKKEKNATSNADILRRNAEERLKFNHLEVDYDFFESDTLKLIHELEVHQVELQMQNEELIRAKENAEAATEKYIELYDFAPSGYVTLSPDCKIEELNLTGARMLGKVRSNLKGNLFSSFVTSDTRPVFYDFFTKVWSSKIKEACEIELISSGDYPIYVHVEGVVSEKTEHCLLTLVDISDYKRAADLLEISNRQKNLILEAAGEGILGMDILGNGTFANPMALEILGYKMDELQGQNSHNLLHHHHADGSIYLIEDCHIQITLRSGIPHYGEDYFWRKDGTGFPVAYSSLPVIEDFKITGAVVTFLDISARKKAEDDLFKAEESDRLKTAFLQNMSHEIRTPMNAIMGFSSLLVKNYNNKIKLEKYSEIINRRCNDLLYIINDILDISKIESGQLPVNLEPCNLKVLFDELKAFFTEQQNSLGKQLIQFSLYAHCDTNDRLILTDKVKLEQIFINLIGNAFKFTETGKIEGGCKYDSNHQLQFYVSDTGMGIPADKQKMVFERFSQLNQGLSRNTSGTGLGLSIVKGLVNLLGGEISLQSEVGKGSTFTFSIHYEKMDAGQTESVVPDEPEEYLFSGRTILVVEDDKYNAEYLKEILSDTGFSIIHTEYGREALQIILSQNIDVVLMDIRLPDMTGYDAIRKIRRHNSNLKIIVQTAYASNEEKQKALDTGGNDYICKPTKKELLLAMIGKQLSKITI